MAETTTTIDTEKAPKSHTGWHAFFGVVGAIVGLVFGAGAVLVGYDLYVNHAPANIQARVQSDYQRLASDLNDLKGGNANVVPLPALPPPAMPNGTYVKDGFDPNGMLQRSETERYDPIERLAGVMSEQNKKLADTIASDNAETNQKIQTVTDSVNGLDRKVTASIQDLSVKVGGLNDRVTKLETASAQPTPAPAPVAPQGTETAPVAPSAPTPGPQASIPAPVQTAQNDRIVTLGSANQHELEEMYAAGKALGRLPNGRKVAGFEEIPRNEGFTCPDGTPGRLVLNRGNGVARRWACPHH